MQKAPPAPPLQTTPLLQETKKSDDCELPTLTDDEKLRYKDFWGRFRSRSNQSLELLDLTGLKWAYGFFMALLFFVG